MKALFADKIRCLSSDSVPQRNATTKEKALTECQRTNLMKELLVKQRKVAKKLQGLKTIKYHEHEYYKQKD